MVSERTLDAAAPAQPNDAGPHSPTRGWIGRLAMLLGAVGILLAINQQFLLNAFGFQPLGNSYLYYLIGLFLSVAFLTLPVAPYRNAALDALNLALVALALVSTGWLGWHGLEIIQRGWEFDAPTTANVMAAIVLLLVLEGVRRAGGWALLFTALLFGTFPLYADHMPGFLWGTQFAPMETVRAHVLGVESIIGIPMQVVAELVIGFVIFGSVLVSTKGGEFFMTLSMALLGRSRGGPAKVAVLSSAVLGSLSGSVISNILTSGPFTIPTMRRVGYPKNYAAAIEACASTGATLMPPVMGTVAFVMASFLGVPYSTIIVAAIIPAVLFYIALLFQADMFAAKNNLKGLPAEEIPPLWPALKSGWPYLLSLAVLIFVLMGLRMEARAPYYASLVMLAATAFRAETRLTLERASELLSSVTANIANLVAILAGIGLVVGGLSYTGVAGAFSRELLLYAGGSVPLMLLAGAVTSFVLGMGMTVTACYIFLSILLAPALIQAGLNPLASHLFILYWGMLSYITPPVALASITAANLAGSNPMATAFHSMRLGLPLFVLPFIFVYDPALIMEGSFMQVVTRIAVTLVAIWSITAAFEGWIYGIGRVGIASRVAFALGGVLIILPELVTSLLGAGLLAVVAIGHLLAGRGKALRIDG